MDAVRGCLRDPGRGAWAQLAAGVALSNARVYAYFYVFVTFSLSEAFFALTVLRVACSWALTLALALLVPRAASISAFGPSEQRPAHTQSQSSV